MRAAPAPAVAGPSAARISEPGPWSSTHVRSAPATTDLAFTCCWIEGPARAIFLCWRAYGKDLRGGADALAARNRTLTTFHETGADEARCRHHRAAGCAGHPD